MPESGCVARKRLIFVKISGFWRQDSRRLRKVEGEKIENLERFLEVNLASNNWDIFAAIKTESNQKTAVFFGEKIFLIPCLSKNL